MFRITPDCRAYISARTDRKSTRLNSSHGYISYAVFCLKKKKKKVTPDVAIQQTMRSCCLLSRRSIKHALLFYRQRIRFLVWLVRTYSYADASEHVITLA